MQQLSGFGDLGNPNNHDRPGMHYISHQHQNTHQHHRERIY
jgi:hypothetical protein